MFSCLILLEIDDYAYQSFVSVRTSTTFNADRWRMSCNVPYRASVYGFSIRTAPLLLFQETTMCPSSALVHAFTYPLFGPSELTNKAKASVITRLWLALRANPA